MPTLFMQIVSYDTTQYQRLLHLVSTNTVKERDVSLCSKRGTRFLWNINKMQCHDLQEHDLNYYYHKKLSITSGIYLPNTQSLFYALVVFLKKCMSIKRDLLYSRILHSVDQWPVTDVSGQPISPIYKDQAVQEECQEHLRMQLYREWCRWW